MVLTDKIILITGASSGIGRACARSFAREGCHLILIARRRERIEQLVQELETAHSIRCYAAPLDIRDGDAVSRAVATLPDSLKSVDILLNNAGLSRGLDPLHQGKLEDWEEMIDTNIKGLLYVTRAVAPGMVERGRGHIINIGSIAGRMVYPSGNVYCATKFAVRALNQGMMMDLLGKGVRVSTVDPGLVETEFSLVRYRGDRERADPTYKGYTPLTPDDVAEAVLFVAQRPPAVNISELVILPADQASPYHINRKGGH